MSKVQPFFLQNININYVVVDGVLKEVAFAFLQKEVLLLSVLHCVMEKVQQLDLF